ncbi:hypothetical protein M427DRAFT_314535 [Gonapodya prolifera JEL478]|uniref:Uncharacterized protein n=1 Tax=Gonapodya prolifera (strain JEL478) TaxID=1344416 RepID=A0A139AX11_GONPJ|nr:hypothetical protein M427DRAFT_314535 [Gonapodya prolifera JEL478]|eukprot:KXS21258.1 hypothetical protein M427DRAFT_314535 [Gonapodya prolifera JEL478]
MLMAAATFPIRYVRAQQYERALTEYRELNDEEGYDAHSGSSGGTLEMGKYGNGNQRWNGPKGWKWSYTEPPNFNTPLDNAKTQQGDISNGRYNNNGGAKPPRKPNKTYAGPGGDRGDPRAWQGPPPDMPAPDYDDPADDSDATWAGNGPQRRQQYAEPEMDRRNQNRKSVNGGRDRGDHRGGDQYAQPAPSRRSESGNRPQYQQPPQSMAAPYAQSQRRPAEPQYPQSQYRQAPPQSNVQPRWASGNGRPPQGNGYGNSGIPGAMDVQGPPPSESEDERDMAPRNQPPRYNNGGGNGQSRRR